MKKIAVFLAQPESYTTPLLFVSMIRRERTNVLQLGIFNTNETYFTTLA